jgi:limonene-1,2-epoxide hydrolase
MLAIEPAIQSVEQLRELWTDIYTPEGRPDWSHILPYYDELILFRDSVQEIRGKAEFAAMTERLIQRSGSLAMEVKNTARDGNVIFLEWVMTLSFKKYPKSSVYGATRITLNDAGKIVEQRDYYDLWGDIFDNIPRFGPAYRKFMRRKFG